MPYCPKCQDVFQAGIGICPDCDVPLVEHALPPRGSAVLPDDSWVVVGDIVNREESKLAKGSLDSSNIPSMVLPSRIGWFGQIRPTRRTKGVDGDEGNLIMVPREYQDEAAAILEAVLGEDMFGSGAME
jgi:hypothetical protein